MNEVNKHSMIKIIMLHLFPGIIIAFAYFIFADIVTQRNLPNDFADDIVMIICMIPIEIGVLIYSYKKLLGENKIEKLFPWFEKSKVKEYIYFIPIMAVWAVLVSKIFAPFEEFLQKTIFNFIPNYLILGNYEITSYSPKIIVLVAIFGVICNGIIAPLVEELYFRGYLLPRIPLSQNKSVALNAMLFSLYHFFSPWCFFSRFFMMLPLYWWVAKKKNIRFSIMAHMIANSITSLSILGVLI